MNNLLSKLETDENIPGVRLVMYLLSYCNIDVSVKLVVIFRYYIN